MCTISLTLAKPGEAMPGPYSSLTCFAGVRPGAVPERGEIGGHRHRRARWSIHSGQRRAHSGRCGACARHSGEARDRLWRSGSFRVPRLCSTHGPHPLLVRAVSRVGWRLERARGGTRAATGAARALARTVSVSSTTSVRASHTTTPYRTTEIYGH